MRPNRWFPPWRSISTGSRGPSRSHLSGRGGWRSGGRRGWLRRSHTRRRHSCTGRGPQSRCPGRGWGRRCRSRRWPCWCRGRGRSRHTPGWWQRQPPPRASRWWWASCCPVPCLSSRSGSRWWPPALIRSFRFSL